MSRRQICVEEDDTPGHVWIESGALTWDKNELHIVWAGNRSDPNAVIGEASNIAREGKRIMADIRYFDEKNREMIEEMLEHKSVEMYPYANNVTREHGKVLAATIRCIDVVMHSGFPNTEALKVVSNGEMDS